MAQLSELIQQAKLNEILRNETALAHQLALPPAADLCDETKRQLAPFIQWATSANVRYCPALPTTVGAYVLALAASCTPQRDILAQVAAIAAMHDVLGLPSPVHTSAVSFALEQVVKADLPPRSWTKSEKALWATLPAQIRDVIQRRDKDTERSMRRSQNEAAELRNKLRLQADAGKAAHNTEKGITTMANNVNKDDRDWHGPQGSNSMGKDKLRKDESGRAYPTPKSIYKKVFDNGDRTDGASAKLDKGE